MWGKRKQSKRQKGNQDYIMDDSRVHYLFPLPHLHQPLSDPFRQLHLHNTECQAGSDVAASCAAETWRCFGEGTFLTLSATHPLSGRTVALYRGICKYKCLKIIRKKQTYNV